jgi:hypothetical protein
MNITKIAVRDEARDFVREFVDDPQCLGLLRFFGTHPYTRFSRSAVLNGPSVNGDKSFLERALGRLVDQGIIKERIENGLSFYSLTVDGMLGSWVMELADLDWSEWQVLANPR